MKQKIATTFLLSTILLAGITACNRSNSSDVPQSDTSQSNASPSPEQNQKRQAVRKQIEAVLTPDQLQQLQAKLQQGTKMREALSSLNLTSDQKAKIQEIYKAARAQRQNQSKENSQ